MVLFYHLGFGKSGFDITCHGITYRIKIRPCEAWYYGGTWEIGFSVPTCVLSLHDSSKSHFWMMEHVLLVDIAKHVL